MIPVLFLAVAVQGRLYDTLLAASRDANVRGAESARLDDYSLRASATRIVVDMGGFLIAFGILAFGAAGEIQALMSVYWQRPAGKPGVTLTALVFLTAVVASGPAVALIRNLLDSAAPWRSATVTGEAARNPAEQQPATAEGAVRAADAEAGTGPGESPPA